MPSLNNNITIRAIIFDMGDIFFDATIWRRWLVQEMNAQQIHVSYTQLCEIWETKLYEVYKGNKEYWSQFALMLGEFGLLPSKVSHIVELGRNKAKEIEHRQLFPGVKDTLHQLKSKGIKMAVLSDSESTEAKIRQRLKTLGIEQYFNAVISSIDIGYVKPEPEAYQAALHELGADRFHTAFVGHDTDELQGAQDFGLQAWSYNVTKNVVSDYHLDHFSDLIVVTTHT